MISSTFIVTTRGRDRSRGFSMIELMVALVVGLFLIGAMLAVVMTSAATGKTRERASDLQNNGRYALELMKRDIQHAGFTGYTSVLSPDAPVGFAVANVCDVNFIGKLSRRVWAEDNNNPYGGAGGCIPNNNYEKDTDVLVVRHLSPTPVVPNKSDLIYFRSAYEGGVAYLGAATAPDFTAKLWTDPFDYLLEESVYYISPWTTAENEKPQIPALYRMRLTGNGAGPAMVPELVASGIENLQVRVRQTSTLTTSSYTKPTGGTLWGALTAVEVSLIARSSAAEPGYKNKETLTLGGEAVTVKNDGFRREVFTTVVYLRN